MKTRRIIAITAAAIAAAAVAFGFWWKSYSYHPYPVRRQPTNEEIAEIGRYAKIKPSDSEDVKKRKRKYNEIERYGKKLEDEHQKKVENGTLTQSEDEQFLNETEKLNNEQKKLDINPEDDETADEKYMQHVDGVIDGTDIVMSGCLDDNGRVEAKEKAKYNRAKKRKKYLEKIKKEYYAGKISAEEALKSFDEQKKIQ